MRWKFIVQDNALWLYISFGDLYTVHMKTETDTGGITRDWGGWKAEARAVKK